jgi:hypothetical protein
MMTARSEYQMLNLKVFALVLLTTEDWCVSGDYRVARSVADKPGVRRLN